MHLLSPLVSVTIAATALSTTVCLLLGFYQKRRTRSLGDLIPIQRGREASVRSGVEFSSATVAATVSLATVIMAFFELASSMGTWLLWTVVTTSAGILAVRIAAPYIIQKLKSYGERIPTLHEFLGTEFDSPTLALIGALATTMGYLGAWAVELTVGSRLFVGLGLPLPAWAVVVFFSVIGITYTAMGGFRVVIVTDRIQMIAIWLSLGAFVTYFLSSIKADGSLATAFGRLPHSAWDFSSRDGLLAFVIGIAVINVPSFVSDQAMWQRVSSAREPSTISRGLVWSSASAAATWALIAIIAICAPMVSRNTSAGPLVALLQTIGRSDNHFNWLLLFLIVVGLVAAMLSTSSTLLIALSHTFTEDVLHRRKTGSPATSNDLRSARIVLASLAAVSVLVVELLARVGFSIADLVFAIYGSQLSLFAPVVVGLVLPRPELKAKSTAAALAVGLGFLSGWTSAVYGRLHGIDNLVFLAPAVSLFVSVAVLGTTLIFRTKRPVLVPLK
ncbi:MAG: hypothetical protein P4L56_22940 [Candidatus Sulfopaludibacter sp.]|nr:hypothetical protein [Candidatus Sulfopaludibacter sp.]